MPDKYFLLYKFFKKHLIMLICRMKMCYIPSEADIRPSLVMIFRLWNDAQYQHVLASPIYGIMSACGILLFFFPSVLKACRPKRMAKSVNKRRKSRTKSVMKNTLLFVNTILYILIIIGDLCAHQAYSFITVM